jgi:hypothetical protein
LKGVRSPSIPLKGILSIFNQGHPYNEYNQRVRPPFLSTSNTSMTHQTLPLTSQKHSAVGTSSIAVWALMAMYVMTPLAFFGTQRLRNAKGHDPIAPIPPFDTFRGTLDLSMIKQRVKQEEDWNATYADRVEEEYKRFLFIAAFHDVRGVPSTAVDKMWHTHILDTLKYMRDCRMTLTRPYLHHHPAYTDDDKAALHQNAMAFIDKYRSLFGTPPADIWPVQDTATSCDQWHCGSDD